MYINIAIAKGRLVEQTLHLLENLGVIFDDYSQDSRKLIFENKENLIRIVLVKASDVPTYVEKGAADIGVVGKDTLAETTANVYEMVDLGIGHCKFAVAGIKDIEWREKKKWIVATKYPKVAEHYFSSKDIPIEIIKLNGSVELAPIVGLSDVIVDIVETGKTLEENGLTILEDISEISARLIVNKASFKTNFHPINELIHHIQTAVQSKGVSL